MVSAWLCLAVDWWTMREESLYTRERQEMVKGQIAARGVRDPRVLEAMRSTPRHAFVQPEHCHLAYTDGPLPIGYGQTISQPYIVALMTELLELKGDEKVLEVGTGSGYQAAVLAHLAREVHSIERYENLALYAARILEQLGLENVHVHTGDGSLGLPGYAPFTAIIVTAAAPSVPKALLDQLEAGGRLVIPVGSRGGQVLERWRRNPGDQESGQAGEYSGEAILPVAFVPLVGEAGWKA
jgi:protein-L-isoaspartate(D-aspartate) O-methyltransferase